MKKNVYLQKGVTQKYHVRWVLIGVLVLMSTGCSFAFMKRPPSEETIRDRQLKPQQIECTEGYAAPITDFLLGAASIETVIGPLIFIPSAIYGFMEASECNQYVDGTAPVYRTLKTDAHTRKTPPHSQRVIPPKGSANPETARDAGQTVTVPIKKKPATKTETPVATGQTTFCADQPDGVFCDDGNRCTEGERCRKGQCRGQETSCDDGQPCTQDQCVPNRGCVHRPLVPCCGDGDKTPLEGCDDGNRVAGDGCSAMCTLEMRLRRLDTRDESGRYLSRQGDAQEQAKAFCRAAYYDDWAAQIPDSFDTGDGYAYPLDSINQGPQEMSGAIQRQVQCRLPPP